MGPIIAGDDWLLDLGTLGSKARQLAADLLRCQILTARRRGHIIRLGDAPTRRMITARAPWGRVPNVVVPCLGCGWSAHLVNWVAATHITIEQGERLFAERAGLVPINDLRYLLCCDAEDYSESVLAVIEMYLGRT